MEMKTISNSQENTYLNFAYLYLNSIPCCDIWDYPTSFFKDTFFVFMRKNLVKTREQLITDYKLKRNGLFSTSWTRLKEVKYTVYLLQLLHRSRGWIAEGHSTIYISMHTMEQRGYILISYYGSGLSVAKFACTHSYSHYICINHWIKIGDWITQILNACFNSDLPK